MDKDIYPIPGLDVNYFSGSRSISRQRYGKRYRSRDGDRPMISGCIPFLLLLCGVERAYGNSPPAAGLNTSDTVATSLIQESAGMACSQTEYSRTYMCKPHWTIARKCVINAGDGDISKAVDQCKRNRGKLLQIENLAEHQGLANYIPTAKVWIAMKRTNGKWKWLQDNKEVTYFNWKSGQPAGNNNCAAFQAKGWEAYSCDQYLPIYCDITSRNPSNFDVYKYANVTGLVTPTDHRYLEDGANFSLSCTAYVSVFGSISLKAKNFDGTLEGTYRNVYDCVLKEHQCRSTGENTYHMNKHRCIRKTDWTFTFYMSTNLDKKDWFCCTYDEAKEECLYMATFHYSYDPSRPILTTSDPDLVVEIGQNLTWTCQNNLGTAELGTIALISFYDCGNWASQFKWKEDLLQRREYSSRSPCAEVVNVTTRFDASLGKVLNVTAKVLVTDFLEGAILACFSYGALEMFENGFTKDETDTLAVYSTQIKLTYKPAVPQLTVKYHAQPPNIYRNVKLWAVCDAQVGRGGGIMWTLKSSTGREEFRTELGGEPPETPPNIEIDTFPKTCPEDWAGSIASGTCLNISEIANSWEDARRVCQEENSDLVRILNSDTLGFLNSILDNDGYWIGLNDMDGDEKLNWLNDTRLVANHSGWATLVERTEDPPNKTCVFMHGGKWYEHGCQNRLKSVCETAPGSYFSEYEYDRGKKPEMRSVFTVMINSSLDSATLECQVTSPNISTNDLKVESIPFTLIDPEDTADQYDMQTLYLNCTAHLNYSASMDIVIFSKERPKYTYTVELVNQEVKGVKPAAEFNLTDFMVTDFEIEEVSIKAALKSNETLDNPYMKCYPHADRENKSLILDSIFIPSHKSSPQRWNWSMLPIVLMSVAAVSVGAGMWTAQRGFFLIAGAVTAPEE